jgi:hypothetical protein
MSALKFLFTATLNDGTVIEQNHEDKGSIEGKNCFASVLARIDDVVEFGFTSTETAYAISVSLIDGSFNANGVRFSACPSEMIEKRIVPTKYRLVYFKKVTQHMSQAGEHLGTATEFHCGWQTTVDGRNFQQTVSVT